MPKGLQLLFAGLFEIFADLWVFYICNVFKVLFTGIGEVGQYT